MRFVAPPGLDRARLDVALVELWHASGRAAVTRAEVQRWVEAGAVSVDGRPARASARVRAGATIECEPLAPPPTSAEPDARVVFDVVFEDEFLLVVDKPAGLVVHPSRGHAAGTLVNGLLARTTLAPEDPRPPAPGADGLPRPGIVHRLDKGTSGVMVVAKDAATREGLKALFAAHDIERAYVAICVGATGSQTITRPHARHPTDRLRFTSRLGTGRIATTHLEALESLAGGRATLVRCRLETGRTHQIRVHLSEVAATPVLGDPVYGPPPRDAIVRAVGDRLGHQALHAETLGFRHPRTGRELRWSSPPPLDFRAALEELRAMAGR